MYITILLQLSHYLIMLSTQIKIISSFSGTHLQTAFFLILASWSFAEAVSEVYDYKVFNMCTILMFV